MCMPFVSVELEYRKKLVYVLELLEDPCSRIVYNNKAGNKRVFISWLVKLVTAFYRMEYCRES